MPLQLNTYDWIIYHQNLKHIKDLYNSHPIPPIPGVHPSLFPGGPGARCVRRLRSAAAAVGHAVRRNRRAPGRRPTHRLGRNLGLIHWQGTYADVGGQHEHVYILVLLLYNLITSLFTWWYTSISCQLLGNTVELAGNWRKLNQAFQGRYKSVISKECNSWKPNGRGWWQQIPSGKHFQMCPVHCGLDTSSRCMQVYMALLTKPHPQKPKIMWSISILYVSAEAVTKFQ